MTTDERDEPAKPAAPAFEAATFRAPLGTTFDVDLGRRARPRAARGRRRRANRRRLREVFRLVSRSSQTACSPQGSYAFHHQALGLLAPFIVPIVGSDAERIVYEACFSQRVPAKLPAIPWTASTAPEDA